jgi:formate dehydrogenase (NADP+) alpha subunit
MKAKDINLKIDGMDIKTEKDVSILTASLENDIYIPHLCYHPSLKPFGACRLCMVELQDGRMVTSCETMVEEGMEVSTETDKISQVRSLVAKLLIANHESDCLNCSQNDQCKLQEIAAYLGINKDEMDYLRHSVPEIAEDTSNPFFDRDLKKCILCGICVRICNETLGLSAVEFGSRGYETRITTFGDKPISESSCVSCGECVMGCPVGALVPKNALQPSREVKTICPYCGVGCNIYLGVRGDKIVSVRADTHNEINKGNLCVKGRFGYNFVNHPDRLTSPLIKRGEKFVKVSWEEALDHIANNLSKYKGKNFGAISSARCTNEDNYILQKFTRVVMGTNNVDNCARSCHAPSVAGLATSMGSGAMSNSIDEIGDAACILAIGTNTTSSYPVIGMRIIQAVNNDTKLIVIDPRGIELSKHANIYLKPYPGTDVALLMGMMKVIADEELLNKEFVEERCEDFSKFKKSLKSFDLDSVEQITGVEKNKIIEAARLYASTKPASILYSLGITEHSHGTDNVFALSNLALLTGNVGKPSTGVNPLRGQNNVQGACDMGCLPDVYPGYQKVDNSEVNEKMGELWSCDLDKSIGLKLPFMIGASSKDQIKALYIMGENPVLSEPDSNSIRRSLEKLEFLIVQDIFLTETALLADVVLPASSFAEKEGTFTNAERRVQRVRKAIEPIGNSKPDWQIICKIAQKMGKDGFGFDTAAKVAEEISSIAPLFGGICYPRIEDKGLQWPCLDENHEGTSIMHTECFSTENGKAKFIPLSYRPSAELPDENYPLLLTTGRSIYHYHTATMTGMIDGLKELYNNDFIEINPVDATKLEIEDGDLVDVASRRGEIQTRVKITDESPPGVVFMTFHFGETPTNVLTNPAMDPISNTPEFKVCAVRVKKCKI